jgi:hypothetical protein
MFVLGNSIIFIYATVTSPDLNRTKRVLGNYKYEQTFFEYQMIGTTLEVSKLDAFLIIK